MTLTDRIEALSVELVAALTARGKQVATAESCTGGWIAKSLTDVAGSSAVFAYGIVSYSNGAKESLLGVAPRTLQEHGAVSEATVREMAEGVLALSGADLAVAVSGIAGPDGGSKEKPVGTVWLAIASRGARTVAQTMRFDGDRDAVRASTVEWALAAVRDRLAGDG